MTEHLLKDSLTDATGKEGRGRIGARSEVHCLLALPLPKGIAKGSSFLEGPDRYNDGNTGEGVVLVQVKYRLENGRLLSVVEASGPDPALCREKPGPTCGSESTKTVSENIYLPGK